jgi:DNA-binding PadR family transcriptional regulator
MEAVMSKRNAVLRHTRGERRFEKGDIKYVILDLLQDRASYGYEIMRALEERFGGLYKPSAGTVYPTLQMLEDLGYVTAEQQEGRKVYTLTEAGRQFLAERHAEVKEVRDRMHGWWDRRSASHEMYETFDDLDDLKKLLRRERRRIDSAKLPRIRDVIARTYRDIESILRE